MKAIQLQYPHHLSKDDLPETVCAIGFFDGIHLGHQRVIKKAVELAQKQRMESAVITFYPHPKIVLSKGQESIEYITPPNEKISILKKLGVDRLYTIKFDQEFSSLKPEKFIDHFISGLNVQHLVAGFDFTYGFKGAGNMNNISEFAKGYFTYTTIGEISQANEKISSTKIRELIARGDIETANLLLDRPFQTSGTVIQGNQRGRTIGYPTANIETCPDALLPKVGVYAIRATVKGATYSGMANLGFRPTFDKDPTTPLLEVHLFDMNENLYNHQLHIEWFEFIRSEKKFSSVDELVKQLKQDEKLIRNYFGNE